MTIEICVKSGTTYTNELNDLPKDICYYHLNRRNNKKYNYEKLLIHNLDKDDLINYLNRGLVCQASINHVKELIKKL